MELAGLDCSSNNEEEGSYSAFDPRVAIYYNESVEYQRDYPYISCTDLYPEMSRFDIKYFNKKNFESVNSTLYAMRELFLLYGLDKNNFGTDEWNPLGYAIEPGMKVLIKPNVVLHKNLSGQDLFCSITHPSVIVAAMSYALIALDGKGEVIIADAPQWNCDIEKLLLETRLDEIAKKFSKELNTEISFRDLRRIYGEYDDRLTGLARKEVLLDGDPEGYCDVELGELSAFWGQPWLESIYGSDHDRSKLRKYHNQNRHAYNISKSLLNSDIVINVPKIKTHKKAGLTCAMKNFIGINGDKNCLPHFRIGYDSAKMQDEMPLPKGTLPARALKKVEHRFMWFVNDTILANKTRTTYKIGNLMIQMERSFKKGMGSSGNDHNEIGWGNWYGNNTIAATTLDMNNIVLYSDKNGTMRAKPQRRVINIVDGIVGGEGEGPLAPTPKECGVLILGSNMYAVDFAVCALMGFSSENIPTLTLTEVRQNAGVNCGVSNADIQIRSNSKDIEYSIGNGRGFFRFRPSQGWKGHVELNSVDFQNNTQNPDRYRGDAR